MLRRPLAILWLLSPLLAQAPDKQLLRYRLQPDSVHHFVIESSSDLDLQQGERRVKSGMHMQLWVEFRLGQVQGGKAAVTQTFYRLKATMDVPGSRIEFDSDDPKSDAGMLAQTKDMLGKPFTMQLDDRGRISDVKLPPGSKDDLVKALGGGALDQFFGQYFAPLPEAAVAVGDTWDSKNELELGPLGKGNLTVHHRLARSGGGEAVIEQGIEVAFEPGRLPVPLQVEDAKGSATIGADGFLGGSEVRLRMTGTGEQPGGGKTTTAMDVRMSMRKVEPPAKK